MSRLLFLTALCTSSLALAEGGWLTTRGRLDEDRRLEVFGGTDSFGVGMVSPDGARTRTGLHVEVVYAWLDRTVEARAGRIWQLTPTQGATVSAALSGATFLVPDRFDAAAGLHGAIALALGGTAFHVDLAYELGLDVFSHGTVRLPQRGTLGLNARLGDWGLSLQGRAGADIVFGGHFVGRGEVLLSLSWFGLGRLLGEAP